MKINLKKEMFGEREFLLAQHGEMRAVAFRYSTGVEALRVENTQGSFVILPYQGQQIWRANFAGRDLVMKTTIKEPVPGVPYLQTYGGFLYHCGIGSIGVPDAAHPQHGEIPNIAYHAAYLLCGEDENGRYMAIGGILDYDIAFVKRYRFQPECRLYEDGTVLKIHVEIENKRNSPLEYAYLCHINFAPVDGAQLLYNAKLAKVHKIVPDGLSTEHKAALSGYMDALERDPSVGDTVGAPGQCYDPEICCTMLYEGERGYTMQYVENEGACYASHPTAELPYAIRWISRTDSEASMGMVLPATCEHLGYEYAKANGQMKQLPPKGSICFDIEAGWLNLAKADGVREKIGK